MHGFETFRSDSTDEIAKANKVNPKPTRVKEEPCAAARLPAGCVYRELVTG